MSSLFEPGTVPQPLAERLRPQALQDVVGQSHLLGPGKPLRMAFDSRTVHSMILWGPPGVGKTTIARLTAHHFDMKFIALSAIFAGVKEIRTALDEARIAQQQGKGTILFVDEIHRFNKAQQDGLLPFVESGLIVLIGATTENPSFELNSALLSRTQVHVLQPLGSEELGVLIERAASALAPALSLDREATEVLVQASDGDARRALNLVELLGPASSLGATSRVDAAMARSVLAASLRRFDKTGDAFYDQISALHKSVRGSDPDAALYWLCRMLDGGADPLYLARRIIRMAWEDVGLADPRAMQLTNDAAQTYERLGSPEGELALAQAVIFMAVAPKSNAGYMAYNAARRFVKQDASRPVPMHLRNAPTKLMKSLGAGAGYRYAHDEPHGYAAGETYLPEGLSAPGWYDPKDQGLEQKIRQKLSALRRMDDEALKPKN